MLLGGVSMAPIMLSMKTHWIAPWVIAPSAILTTVYGCCDGVVLIACRWRYSEDQKARRRVGSCDYVAPL